ncbi:transient receptor potential cation channel subfamily V member 6 [Brienomyrus brachyistius]|uniref:transient receptor potential cation channel subfamily V member 6 n=1 Tax=Brienomyrus brachyistius TaxID=42636 RepID=UPI0020B436BB|nr:transient receptor potential cation channel subfamily V member 6 [Brienomyrus brachyistius]
MGPPLARIALSELSHRWGQLRFRLKNKKAWTQMVDEIFMLQSQRVNDIPLFFAAHENAVGSIKKLLKCPSTDIFERGALGETALHVAALANHLEASVAIMEEVPELINEPMTSDLYQGLTALHIAVMNQNLDLVKELIANGADVATPRVTGIYFMKRRGGLLYYGEHIVSFAACVGNEEILSALINAGANIRAQDSFGNTVLHILAMQNSKESVTKVIDIFLASDKELNRDIPLDRQTNYRGLTPLKASAKEGNMLVFQHLVNSRRRSQWTLGPLNSHLYDLTEFDSYGDEFSVLENVIVSHKKEARKVLDVPPAKQLIDLKWKLYAKHYFRFLALLYHLYMGIFTLCCVYRPLKPIPENYTLIHQDNTIYIPKTLDESYLTYNDQLRLVGEMISVLGAFIILVLEIPDIMRIGPKQYFGQSVLGGPFHATLIGYSCLVLLVCLLRVAELPGEENAMSLALILGWCNIMYFARGFQMLGPYMIMVQKILCGDVVRFIWLITVTLLACTTAMWMIYMTQDPTKVPSFRSFGVTLFSEFEVSIGLVDLIVDNSQPNPPIVYVLHVVFSLVCSLLIINLLISMMGDTHWKVTQERDELWKTQLVATILMLERRLPRCLWPRIGVNGAEYNLGDCWYLRVEDRNEPDTKKTHQPVNSSSSDSVKNEPTSSLVDIVRKAKPIMMGGAGRGRGKRNWQVLKASYVAQKQKSANT